MKSSRLQRKTPLLHPPRLEVQSLCKTLVQLAIDLPHLKVDQDQDQTRDHHRLSTKGRLPRKPNDLLLHLVLALCPGTVHLLQVGSQVDLHHRAVVPSLLAKDLPLQLVTAVPLRHKASPRVDQCLLKEGRVLLHKVVQVCLRVCLLAALLLQAAMADPVLPLLAATLLRVCHHRRMRRSESSSNPRSLSTFALSSLFNTPFVVALLRLLSLANQIGCIPLPHFCPLLVFFLLFHSQG